MNLVYKASVFKQIKKPPPSERKKVIKKIERLKNDPLAGKVLFGEFFGLRSLRAWPYRIIYEAKEKTLTIISVSHRQSAY